jgi:hypothetical protein
MARECQALLAKRHTGSFACVSAAVDACLMLLNRFVKSRLMSGGSNTEAIYELCKVQEQEFTYTTASREETIKLCGLEKLLKGGNTNLPLAASIKIQARARGLLQRKKDRQKRANHQAKPANELEKLQQDDSQAKQVTPRPTAVTAAAVLSPAEPQISLESLPKGLHPSIAKLAKTVADQRRAAADALKKAAAGKAALHQTQQERLAMQARAERAEEELRFFRAAESRSNSRASFSGNVTGPSSNDALAAMGAAHERAAVAEAELASLQSKAAKLQSDVAAVRSETLDGFKSKLSTALAEVSSIEREVRLQVCVRGGCHPPARSSPLHRVAIRVLMPCCCRMERRLPSAAR